MPKYLLIQGSNENEIRANLNSNGECFIEISDGNLDYYGVQHITLDKEDTRSLIEELSLIYKQM